ncbi:MAG: YggS family pyridoxal phosphate-dependent enzyme, partial [Pseudomonadota bacterium]
MSLAQNLENARRRINGAAKAAGREPHEVRLVAVSKTKPAAAVREALAAGQTLFGENYIQESQSKIPEVGSGP